MQITCIRHLPTDWNKKNWLQGKKDIELSKITDDDLKRIEYNKGLLKKHSPFQLVLSSTLKRTYQTALIYGYDATEEGLLDELDFGPFEGQPKEQLIAYFANDWLKNPRKLNLGEKMIDFEKRIIIFLNKYQSYSNILLFGHGSWIRALLSLNECKHINRMNEFSVQNNECFTINLKKIPKWKN